MVADAEYFDSSEFEHRASIEDTHYWHVHRRGVLLDALRAWSPPESTGRLIELGCGIGVPSLAAAHDCYHSPEYPSAVAIRPQVAAGEIVLVEGI